MGIPVQSLMNSRISSTCVQLASLLSRTPNEAEIANDICRSSKNKVYNLAETPLTPGELKALFAKAELVITNDTGPRHIAIALERKVITLFGPNDPVWTRTGYENEIEIIGHAACAPCAKPECSEWLSVAVFSNLIRRRVMHPICEVSLNPKRLDDSLQTVSDAVISVFSQPRSCHTQAGSVHTGSK